MKKQKYPKIEPQFLKNKNGNPVKVLLPYDVYESIFDEIADLEKSIKLLQKKVKKQKPLK